MPAKKQDTFYCKKHGWIKHHFCIQCEAEQYAKDVQSGVIANHKPPEGAGPEPGDPSEVRILLEGRLIQDQNRKAEDDEKRLSRREEKKKSREALLRLLRKR